eukprot:ANDGO_02014.mRNA.1 hypothetical protein
MVLIYVDVGEERFLCDFGSLRTFFDVDDGDLPLWMPVLSHDPLQSVGFDCSPDVFRLISVFLREAEVPECSLDVVTRTIKFIHNFKQEHDVRSVLMEQFIERLQASEIRKSLVCFPEMLGFYAFFPVPSNPANTKGDCFAVKIMQVEPTITHSNGIAFTALLFLCDSYDAVHKTLTFMNRPAGIKKSIRRFHTSNILVFELTAGQLVFWRLGPDHPHCSSACLRRTLRSVPTIQPDSGADSAKSRTELIQSEFDIKVEFIPDVSPMRLPD